MRISYLEIRNYRRFREVKLEFPDGVVGILGLNGTGKTTIIEAIAWALFGNTDEVVRTSREGIRSVAAGSSESCSVNLEFELGGTDYRIEREMGGKSLTMKVTLKSGDTVLADGDKPVKKAVEKLIGMEHKSFFTSVFARQKELNALQNVTPGERKKVVLRMLRIDGVDDILQTARADRRDVTERIKGAEQTLHDEEGRDRESLIGSKVPILEKAVEESERMLKIAEENESKAKKDFEGTKIRRDEAKKDYEAYNSTNKDLSAKTSALRELRNREERLQKRINEVKVKLQRLPVLEKAETDWGKISSILDELEESRRKAERARHLAKDIETDEKSKEQMRAEVRVVEEELSKFPDLEEQAENLDSSRAGSEKARTELSHRIGELKAKRKERTDEASKDRKKLEEISKLGSEGICPTCERRLEDAYELLISKLTVSASEAERAAAEAKAEMEKADANLAGISRREDAFKKKASWIEAETRRRGRLEAQIEASNKQSKSIDDRIASKKRDLEELGKITFSEDEYAKTKSERDRLKPMHDEFVRLKGTQEEMVRSDHEMGEVKGWIDKNSMEERTLKILISELEPKKELYEVVLKDIDEKMNILSKAKDEVRRLSDSRDSSRSELQTSRKELETIERVKKSIEMERTRADDLALLEDVLITFRDHLIGKVAPTLSELTSHVFESMTEGRYSGVELNDSYEIQIDDQGTLYPISRFSGGEADLANLSLRLAISRIIAERTGANPMNFLILDEIFGSLDPTRKRSVMAALSDLSTQFRQIFLITHLEDVKDLMASVIKVEELEDGSSTAFLVS
ncbi:MAG: SMC family ATPase [Thermoplasmata archaeon]|nr:SMC family ATPase [Thermoplasmata archaeon]